MGERWCTVTVIEQSGRRHSVDILASSTFDAAHIFVTHAKADPRNGIPRLSVDSVFEVAVDGKIHQPWPVSPRHCLWVVYRRTVCFASIAEPLWAYILTTTNASTFG
jgi:hypothetical protein